MLWAQAGVCFLAWCGYGVWLARSTVGRRLLRPLRRSTLSGALLLLLGAGLLVAGLFAVGSMGGLHNGALTPWAWAATLMAGCVFVHFQAWGAVCLTMNMLRPETQTKSRPSLPSEEHQ